MYIPTTTRRNILKSLFKTGVLVVKDDPAGIHPELKCLNIYPYQLCRQLVDKKLVDKYYSWSHAYYILNNDGITHLRALFGLKDDVKPEVRQGKKAHDNLESKVPAQGGRHQGRPHGRD